MDTEQQTGRRGSETISGGGSSMGQTAREEGEVLILNKSRKVRRGVRGGRIITKLEVLGYLEQIVPG